MINKEKIMEFIDKVIKMSDADMTTVSVFGNIESLTRFSNNEITQNVESVNFPFTIRCVYGGKVGTVSGSSINAGEIKKHISAARTIAKNQSKKKNILPLPTAQKYKSFQDYDKKTENVAPMKRAEIVKKAITLTKKAKLEGAGIMTNSANYMALGNNKGVRTFHMNSHAEFSLTALSKDSAGWSEAMSHTIKDIDSVSIANTAINKALASKKPIKIEPGKYTVILEPSAVADLISFLSYDVFNTRRFAEGRGALVGKMGKQIMSKNVTMIDNAYIDGINGIPFDFEGYPRQEVTLVKNGVLNQMVQDRKTAKMLKTKNTGHSLGADDEYGPIPLNLHIEPGKSSLEEMIKTTKKGILVTQFHYVNMLYPMQTMITGMTRNGIFLIENGKVKKGLKNLRFTQSILEALSNVEMIGDKCEIHGGGFGGGYSVPSMKIKDFNFTSVTDF